MTYLDSYYFKRTEKWAMCFRNFPHAETDTNMFLESYHNRIKTFYLNRKRNKRLDDLFNLILGIEEDDYWRNKRESILSNGNIEEAVKNEHGHRGMAILN